MIAFMKDINNAQKTYPSKMTVLKERFLNVIKRPHIALYKLIKWRLFHAIMDIVFLNFPMWIVMAVEAKIYYDTYKWIIGHF